MFDRFSPVARAMLLAATTLSIGLVQAAPKGTLFISSEKDDVVYMLDAATLKPRGEIKTNDRPRALVLDEANGLLYVACGDGDAIDVIEGGTAQRRIGDEVYLIDLGNARVFRPEAVDVRIGSDEGRLVPFEV